MYFSYLVVVKDGRMKPSGFLQYEDFYRILLGLKGRNVIVIGSRTKS